MLLIDIVKVKVNGHTHTHTFVCLYLIFSPPPVDKIILSWFFLDMTFTLVELLSSQLAFYNTETGGSRDERQAVQVIGSGPFSTFCLASCAFVLFFNFTTLYS